MGANALIITKPGLYFGGGIGQGNFSYGNHSRESLMFDFLLGSRKKVYKNIGIYGESKFYYSDRTQKDTDDFNSGVLNSPVLFDHDIAAVVGIFYTSF